MRGNNKEILQEVIAVCGLSMKYSEEEIKSFQQWRNMGYKVKKGEKAALKVKLWYPSTYVKENDKEETKFYMKTTALFTIDQVEKIKEE